ncbi:MAG: alkaline phosphatase family protein [Acidimicrobiales bacterium]
MGMTRRRFIGGALAGTAMAGLPGALGPALADPGPAGSVRRGPGSLPHPFRPAGAPDPAMPFDHLVVVMMENHSFDNYFGVLAHSGQPEADGFRFDPRGRPTNANPGASGPVPAFHLSTLCPGEGVSQSWDVTHRSIAGGRMDGFVTANGNDQTMGYWNAADLPFYYSLASTFSLANRWFSSAPCQTYPNRRFLMAGTAYGNIATSYASIFDPPPPNGTIFDRLSAHGITWANYFVDLPQTAIIPSIIEKHPLNLAPVAAFHLACALGTLPAVSFVDPEFGTTSDVGNPLMNVPALKALGARLGAQGGSEEDPQDIRYGEAFVASIVDSVMRSSAWARTVLVLTWDEHGGYYDHVAPPAAIAPDSIAPQLAPGDQPGGYDLYGPRVPAVVVSPYARLHSVTDAVHDHTSVLATIEAKWNLPALTYRDANAATVMDFLDTSHAAFAVPPALVPAANPLPGALSCSATFAPPRSP